MSYPMEYVNAKHYLSQEERNEMAMSLAEKHIDITNLQEEKKGVVSEYTAKIDVKKAEINLMSTHIKDGYITRSVHAQKKKNFFTKQWEWIDPNTGEILKKEAFTGSDFQMRVDDNDDLPFGNDRATLDDIMDTVDRFKKDGIEVSVSHAGQTTVLGQLLGSEDQEPSEEDSEEKETEFAADFDDAGDIENDQETTKKAPKKGRKDGTTK